MALQKQTYRINFGQGLDTKTDPKVLSSGKMVVLQNAKFQAINRLSKRDGFAAVGVVDATGASLKRIDSFRGNVFGFGDLATISGMVQQGTAFSGTNTGRSFWIYDKTQGTPTFKAISPAFSDCVATSTVIDAGQSYAPIQSDSALANGMIVHGYLATRSGIPSVLFRITDATTGQVIKQATTCYSATSAAVRCVPIGNSVLVGWIDTTNHKLFVLPIDTTNIASMTSPLTSSFSYGTVLTGSTQWDWSPHTVGGSAIAFASFVSSATTFAAMTLSRTGSQLSSATITASVTIGVMGVVQPCPNTTSSQYRIIYSDTSRNVRYIPLTTALVKGTETSNADGGNVAAPVTLTGQEDSTLGSCWVFACCTNSVTPPILSTTNVLEIVGYQFNASGTWATNANPVFSLALASKPIYRDDNNVYVWTYFPSKVQQQYLLLRCNPSLFGLSTSQFNSSYFTPAARLLSGQAYSVTLGGMPTVAAGTCYLGGNQYSHDGMMVGTQFTSNAGVVQLGAVAQIKSNFNFDGLNSCELNGQKIIAGGVNLLYDGQQLSELGYLWYPENVSASLTTTSGAIAAGTYQYVGIWEWTDNQGNLHKSETSVPITVTTTGATTNTVKISCPSLLTAKYGAVVSNYAGNQVNFVVYRTTANASPQIFYRVGSTPASAQSGGSIFNDTLADSVITSSEILYTQGGVLDNYTIDGTPVICAGPDRLFASDPNNNGTVHIGKPFNSTDGLSFFSGITIQLPIDDGPITNMIYMDSTLVAFKARSIYAVQGEGPTSNGQNNGFGTPQKITSEIGCDNAYAATLYPDGILFKSAKGYHRLGRDLSFAPDTNYVGAGVESYNSFSCLRAVLRQDLNQARFVLSDNQTILCYDYFFGQWSTIQTSVNDATSTGSNFYVASNTPSIGGMVAQESVGTFSDALLSPTSIPFNIKTGWLALNQLQGCQRIYRVRFLGDFKSSHTMQVTIGYDYESSATEVKTITSANITSGSSAYQFEVFPLRQKCEAIQFQIQDTSVSGESFDLTDIEIEVGIQPGRRFPLSALKGA